MNRLSKSAGVFQILAGIGMAGLTSLADAADANVPPKPDLSRGQVIAAQVCAACHGVDGNSANGVFPKLIGHKGHSVNVTPPKLAGQHADYIVKRLNDFKTQPDVQGPERENNVMAPFADALSEPDMINVAAYFASQKEQPGFARDKALAEAGQRIWRGGIVHKAVSACVSCHGPSGAGIPPQYPRLAGQWSNYTIAQLKAFAQRAHVNTEPMNQIASQLDDREIEAVADYISGLR